MARDVFIFVNGILTNPGNAQAWTDRAEEWFNLHAPGTVLTVKHEYFCPALTRRLFIRGDTANLAAALAAYAAPIYRVHLVAHSNGAELSARAIAQSGVRVASLHLIQAAADRNFHRNGLNRARERGQLGNVYCYCSRGDAVLKYLALASRLATLGLAGYGDLGYHGPEAVEPCATSTVETLWRNQFGHSDWFTAENFGATMHHVLFHAIGHTPRRHAFHPPALL
jgi:pimeloyl-ACP methyl ester carboxylesterase